MLIQKVQLINQMEGQVFIDLTETTDHHGKIILTERLLQNIAFLRQSIVTQRKSDKYIRYKIQFFPNTKVYSIGTDVTQDKDFFYVDLNPKTIYPKAAKDPNTFQIICVRGGKQTTIVFGPNYTGVYCVVEAIGILVAEQIRFNTLEVTRAFEAHDKYFASSEPLFNYWVKNYLEKVYKNWKNATEHPQILPAGIKVVVPYLP